MRTRRTAPWNSWLWTSLAALWALAPSIAQAGVPQTNLSITKTDGALTSVPGEQITYTIVAFNGGPTPVVGAAFGDLFTAPLSNCSWTCVGQNTGSCTTAAGSGPNANQNVDIPVGASVLVTVTCTIDSSATLSFFNTATIQPPAGVDESDGANNSATDVNGLDPEADLQITKSNGASSVVPGGSTTYTVIATNAGPSDSPGATVVDNFPAETSCNWTCVGAGGGTCTAAGAGSINDVVNLPAGSSVTYSANCALDDPLPPSISNTATITAAASVPDPVATNNAATDTDSTAGVIAVPALGDWGLAALASGLALTAARRLRALRRRR
jgi:uncharacterized repeat protein (TIGR01451 family)